MVFGAFYARATGKDYTRIRTAVVPARTPDHNLFYPFAD
jgi:hypothetical protein